MIRVGSINHYKASDVLYMLLWDPNY